MQAEIAIDKENNKFVDKNGEFLLKLNVEKKYRFIGDVIPIVGGYFFYRVLTDPSHIHWSDNTLCFNKNIIDKYRKETLWYVLDFHFGSPFQRLILEHNEFEKKFKSRKHNKFEQQYYVPMIDFSIRNITINDSFPKDNIRNRPINILNKNINDIIEALQPFAKYDYTKLYQNLDEAKIILRVDEKIYQNELTLKDFKKAYTEYIRAKPKNREGKKIWDPFIDETILLFETLKPFTEMGRILFRKGIEYHKDIQIKSFDGKWYYSKLKVEDFIKAYTVFDTVKEK